MLPLAIIITRHRRTQQHNRAPFGRKLENARRDKAYICWLDQPQPRKQPDVSKYLRGIF